MTNDINLNPEDKFTFDEEMESHTDEEIEDEDERALFNHEGRQRNRREDAKGKVSARLEN